MKTILIFVLFAIITAFSPLNTGASDWENHDVVYRLLSIQEPGIPVIQDDFIIFTADSSIRRMGVAFAHENFANIYWFRLLLVPQDRINPVLLPGEKIPSPNRDSGIQFHVQKIPNHLEEVKYRLIVNGLWTTDPTHSQSWRDPVSGLSMSVISLPHRPITPNVLNGLPDGLSFTFNAPPGETVTVAGTFNRWDPFMYELREGPAGVYNLTIPLPPGTYQYVFFHRGERHLDQYNHNRAYARDGSAANVVVVP